MSQYLERVYFVLNTTTDERVSQFYTRAGDAIRKAKSMRHNGMHPQYEAHYCNLDIPYSLEQHE